MPKRLRAVVEARYVDIIFYNIKIKDALIILLNSPFPFENDKAFKQNQWLIICNRLIRGEEHLQPCTYSNRNLFLLLLRSTRNWFTFPLILRFNFAFPSQTYRFFYPIIFPSDGMMSLTILRCRITMKWNLYRDYCQFYCYWHCFRYCSWLTTSAYSITVSYQFNALQ